MVSFKQIFNLFVFGVHCLPFTRFHQPALNETFEMTEITEHTVHFKLHKNDLYNLVMHDDLLFLF